MGRIFQQFPELTSLGGARRPFVPRGAGQRVDMVAQAVFQNLHAPCGRDLLPFTMPNRPLSAKFDDLGHGRCSPAGRCLRYGAPAIAGGADCQPRSAYHSI